MKWRIAVLAAVCLVMVPLAPSGAGFDAGTPWGQDGDHSSNNGVSHTWRGGNYDSVGHASIAKSSEISRPSPSGGFLAIRRNSLGTLLIELGGSSSR